MHIYLINAEGTNRYKIGITSRTIESRLKELNGTQSAFPLRLISSARNAQYRDVERHLHDKYGAYRRHGEWFELDSHELAEVQNYLKTFDTPLRNIRPIFKPAFTRNEEFQPTLTKNERYQPNIDFSEIPLKRWLSPLFIAIGLILAFHSLDFFKAEQHSLTPKSIISDSPKPHLIKHKKRHGH